MKQACGNCLYQGDAKNTQSGTEVFCLYEQRWHLSEYGCENWCMYGSNFSLTSRIDMANKLHQQKDEERRHKEILASQKSGIKVQWWGIIILAVLTIIGWGIARPQPSYQTHQDKKTNSGTVRLTNKGILPATGTYAIISPDSTVMPQIIDGEKYAEIKATEDNRTWQFIYKNLPRGEEIKVKGSYEIEVKSGSYLNLHFSPPEEYPVKNNR